MTYFPLDREILTSTIWTQASPEALKVWMYLLIAADPRTGLVRDTIPSIAHRCSLKIEAVEEILDWLQSPDKYSRTEDHDGRRVEVGPDGIQLLTYLQHRDKDYSTPRVRRWREQQNKAPAKPEQLHRYETVSNLPYPRVGASCPCCARKFQTPLKLYVVLDHDHKTGALRAYICQSCNKLVGQSENGHSVSSDVAPMIDAYLKRFRNDETVPGTAETTDTDTDKETYKDKDTDQSQDQSQNQEHHGGQTETAPPMASREKPRDVAPVQTALELSNPAKKLVPVTPNPFRFLVTWRDANESRDSKIIFDPVENFTAFVMNEGKRLGWNRSENDLRNYVVGCLERFKAEYSKRDRKGKTRGQRVGPRRLTEELVAWLRKDFGEHAKREATRFKSQGERVDDTVRRLARHNEEEQWENPETETIEPEKPSGALSALLRERSE